MCQLVLLVKKAPGVHWLLFHAGTGGLTFSEELGVGEDLELDIGLQAVTAEDLQQMRG